MLTLAMVGVELQRPLVPMIGITTAPSRSRNRVMEFARAADPTHIASWILWLDSDIEVHPDMAPVIARYIREAEQRGQGWSAAYRMSDGRSVLMDAEGDHLTDQEWRHLPDWSPLHWPILGLAYWRTPLDYTFRSSYLGEDILLKEDLGAGAQLHFARGIHVRHFKGVWLEGPRLTVRRGRGDA